MADFISRSIVVVLNFIGSSALTLFLLHYCEWAYKKNLIITPVYDEVKNVLETWKNLNISIFVDVASAHFVNMILDSTTQGRRERLTYLFAFIR